MEDIIITVLALAVGLGFKVIEKKLKSAGKPAKTGRFKELADLFGEGETEAFPPVPPSVAPSVDSEEFPQESHESEQPRRLHVPKPAVIETVASVPVAPAAPVASVAPVEEAPRSVKIVNAPILIEEEPEQKEKIDPKKLVVYSEIMKPKYLE